MGSDVKERTQDQQALVRENHNIGPRQDSTLGPREDPKNESVYSGIGAGDVTLEPGYFVRAVADFSSDTNPGVPLKTGARGTIVRMEDGWAVVNFLGLPEGQWV